MNRPSGCAATRCRLLGRAPPTTPGRWRSSVFKPLPSVWRAVGATRSGCELAGTGNRLRDQEPVKSDSPPDTFCVPSTAGDLFLGTEELTTCFEPALGVVAKSASNLIVKGVCSASSGLLTDPHLQTFVEQPLRFCPPAGGKRTLDPNPKAHASQHGVTRKRTRRGRAEELVKTR